jgi:5-methylthioadenosine/S-adenosylhomocysteine deaminase
VSQPGMSKPSEKPIVLQNGLILCFPGISDPIPHKRTLISGGAIIEINSFQKPTPDNSQVIDCSNCLIMPGLVNCHVHAAMSLFRGLADDIPLRTWLEQYIFPSEARYVSPEMVRLGTTLSAVEMALSGITTFADAYFFMEESARAALDVGLRATIAQGILDVPAPDTGMKCSWKDRVSEFLECLPSDSLISPALFCHSPYLCGSDTFKSAFEISQTHGIKLFSHVAETKIEIDEIYKLYGLSPFEWLDSLGILGENFVAVHGVHLSEEDCRILVDASSGLIHCPESNMKLASGAARINDLLEMGVKVGLGTDSPASNNNLDFFEEMRSASLLAKLSSSNTEALNARQTLYMASTQGARILGLENVIGTLVPGKQADIIIVDLDQPHLTPLYDPVSQMVYCAKASDVRDVMVSGRVVVRNREICTVSYQDVRRSVIKLAGKIGADSGKRLFQEG